MNWLHSNAGKLTTIVGAVVLIWGSFVWLKPRVDAPDNIREVGAMIEEVGDHLVTHHHGDSAVDMTVADQVEQAHSELHALSQKFDGYDRAAQEQRAARIQAAGAAQAELIQLRALVCEALDIPQHDCHN